MGDEKDFKDFASFRNEVLKTGVKGRKAKVNNSVGVYTIYKLIRKNNWYDIGRPLKEHEFYSIIRGVNTLLAKEIGKGNTVRFPSKMGGLELRKEQRGVYLNNGKLHITYPVDWDKTLKLWYTDEEARKNKILIRMEESFVYRIKYCKHDADYNNKSFYEFDLNRSIKKALKENIKAGKADTVYEGH